MNSIDRSLLVVPLSPFFHRLVKIEAAKRGESMAKFTRGLLERELKKTDQETIKQEKVAA